MSHKTVTTILAALLFILLSSSVRAATITVPAGGNLQAAITSAQMGDTIIVQAGAVYVGPFILPNKSGDGVIVIQSSRVAELPVGVRVTPSTQSALLAKLQSNTPAEPIIKTAAGAHHYRLIGVEIMTQTASTVVYDLVRFGDSGDVQKTLAAVPNNLFLDRSYVHGWADQDVQRGIAMNCAECSVTNSYISDIHMVGIEAQAIAGWNGPGPFHIVNNYIEASTQNVLFGGADPGIPNLVPSDIEIRHNFMFKPMTWKVGDPSFVPITRNGSTKDPNSGIPYHWTVKNILELKNARNATIDGNVFQNNWTDGQAGLAILFTARNQNGTCSWCVVEKVTFTNNSVINSEGGVHILRTDAESKGAISSDITIANNLFDRIIGGGAFVLINNPNNIRIVHNTVFKSRNAVTMDARTALNGGPDPKGSGLVFQDNLFSEGDYGVFGSGFGEGTVGLSNYFSNYVFAGNNLAGRDAPSYPAGNTFLTTPQVGFLDLVNGNYRLALSSPLKGKGTDGKDVGADIDALNATQSGGSVSLPTPSPTPSTSPTPSPTPASTPTPAPTPLLPRVVTRVLTSSDPTKMNNQINQIEQNDGLKLISCSGATCQFARRP
jgi:hypothetical protein